MFSWKVTILDFCPSDLEFFDKGFIPSNIKRAHTIDMNMPKAFRRT